MAQKSKPSLAAAFAAGCTLFAVAVGGARAEEGMWTFDNFPSARAQAEIGVGPDQAWLDRVRGAAARLETGCSSAIVSPTGLVQTNHHCVVDCVQNFSRPGEDMVRTGFWAATQAEERRCPGLAIQTLGAISDVTDRITAATQGQTGSAFTAARDAEISRIEAACKGDVADRRCQVVTLYQGGQYKLYTYTRYDDVRLVFAPELDAAFFGGDPDNFNFPRYAFDVAFLRLYANGQPAATPGHLRWRSRQLEAGEPTFVAGNPGSTSRQFTQTQLAFQRDHALPWRLATLSELRGHVLAYSAQGTEQRRQMADLLFGVENSFKALSGRRQALVDPVVQAAAAKVEADSRAFLARNRALRREVGDPWAEIGTAVAAQRRFFLAHSYVETGLGGGADLIGYARTLVRGAAERTKPDAERLPAFTSARLATTEAQLLADRPVEAAVDRLLIEFWATKMREYLTVDDPLVRAALGQESPEALAARIVSTSRLADPAVRRALWESGEAAIAASTDPAIVLVRALDAQGRALRTRFQTEVEAPITQAQARISRVRFAALGDSVYPDATFTLRLSYGRVAGWTDPTGREVPPFTHFAGLYRRATGAEPFALTPRWEAARFNLNPQTIFNVSSTHDIIGGNSGSPLLDRDGQVVGAVFDGNIHSLGGEYVYDGRLNRTVAVASTAVEAALGTVYGADRLVRELRGQ